jgi:hypothetical protein
MSSAANARMRSRQVGGKTLIDPDIAAIRPSQLLERPPECRDAGLRIRIAFRVGQQNSDPPHSLRPLRPRCYRPRRRAAEPRDERPAFH